MTGDVLGKVSVLLVTDRFRKASAGSHIGLYIGENVAMGGRVGAAAWKPTPSDTFQIIFSSAPDTTAPVSV